MGSPPIIALVVINTFLAGIQLLLSILNFRNWLNPTLHSWTIDRDTLSEISVLPSITVVCLFVIPMYTKNQLKISESFALSGRGRVAEETLSQTPGFLLESFFQGDMCVNLFLISSCILFGISLIRGVLIHLKTVSEKYLTAHLVLLILGYIVQFVHSAIFLQRGRTLVDTTYYAHIDAGIVEYSYINYTPTFGYYLLLVYIALLVVMVVKMKISINRAQMSDLLYPLH